MTAGQAMDVLKGEGLVRSEHGGTGRGAYDVEMRQLGLEPGVELVELGPVTPPPEIAERLGLKAGEGPDPSAPDVRRGPADAARISCVPWSFAEGAQMVERDSGPGGRRPTPGGSAVPPAHGPSAGLQPLPDGLRETGTPVEVCEHVMSGDRWLLTYEWAAE